MIQKSDWQRDVYLTKILNASRKNFGNMNFDYTSEDLQKSFERIIIHSPEVLFVSGNLTYLGRGNFLSKQETLETFYKILKEISGKELTIVVPTFSQNLANTDIIFELNNTPTNLGIFPNYILQKRQSVRSFHPFTSFTAIGPKAEFICANNTRFPYGLDSPYERILSLQNPTTVSIGLKPELTCSLVHHAEFNMHVPYRYIKEFEHPVKNAGEINRERFYLHVVYHNINEKRDMNNKFFQYFEKSHSILKEKVGKGYVYSYNMNDLYNSVIELMKKDIYSWMVEEPPIKPYTV